MGRKRKKHCDPNAPKRPSSAYMLYMKECRQQIIEENNLQSSDIAAIGKELGKSWKRMGPLKRQPYESRAHVEYNQYCKAKNLYEATKDTKDGGTGVGERGSSSSSNSSNSSNSSSSSSSSNSSSTSSTSTSSSSTASLEHPNSVVSVSSQNSTQIGSNTSVPVHHRSRSCSSSSIAINKKLGRPRKNGTTLAKNKQKKQKNKRKKRDASEVKKPMTSYLCFCKVARPYLMVHYSNDSFAQMGKKLGMAWKSLTMEDKYPFYAEAEADRLRYLKECREINQDPMYSPSLAGLSVERWTNYIQGKDIQMLPQ